MRLSRPGSIGSVSVHFFSPFFSANRTHGCSVFFLPLPIPPAYHATSPFLILPRLPSHSPQEQYTLSRLARIEAIIADLLRECDSCVEGRLKCDGDGRNPCSWCLKRHAGGVAIFRAASSELEASQQQQHVAATGPPCTYSGYSEQARRYGLHRYAIAFPPPFLFPLPHSSLAFSRFLLTAPIWLPLR